MKDTRAGGAGAITCKWLKMNELETRVVRFHAEPGFFAGEISPLLTRESTGSPCSPNPLTQPLLFSIYLIQGSNLIMMDYKFSTSYLAMLNLFCIFVL